MALRVAVALDVEAAFAVDEPGEPVTEVVRDLEPRLRDRSQGAPLSSARECSLRWADDLATDLQKLRVSTYEALHRSGCLFRGSARLACEMLAESVPDRLKLRYDLIQRTGGWVILDAERHAANAPEKRLDSGIERVELSLRIVAVM